VLRVIMDYSNLSKNHGHEIAEWEYCMFFILRFWCRSDEWWEWCDWCGF